MKVILGYFLQGLLLVLPVGFTIYIIYSLVGWIDKILPRLFQVELPTGTGLVIIIGFVIIHLTLLHI